MNYDYPMQRNFSIYFSHQAYNLLLISSIAFLFISLFHNQDLIDIHIHDTMYVFSFRQLTGFIGIVLLIEWLVYTALRRLLYRNYLTWIHVLATLISLVLLLMAHYSVSGKPIENTVSWKNIQGVASISERILMLSVLLLAVSHIIFAINILTGLLKKRN